MVGSSIVEIHPSMKNRKIMLIITFLNNRDIIWTWQSGLSTISTVPVYVPKQIYTYSVM